VEQRNERRTDLSRMHHLHAGARTVSVGLSAAGGMENCLVWSIVRSQRGDCIPVGRGRCKSGLVTKGLLDEKDNFFRSECLCRRLRSALVVVGNYQGCGFGKISAVTGGDGFFINEAQAISDLVSNAVEVGNESRTACEMQDHTEQYERGNRFFHSDSNIGLLP